MSDAPIEQRVAALQEALTEKEHLHEDSVGGANDWFEHEASPMSGAKVVARAWIDPAYRQRLLADGTGAISELGISGPEGAHMVVVENTPEVHNVIVCTLCSCYPRWLLGLPPDWYKSRSYRSRVVREPRPVLGEFGLQLPDNVTVRVHDSNADMRYLVLPMRPVGTEGFSEEQLAAIVTRDSMIGTALCKADSR